MRILFHIRPDFASGGITEDALTLLESFSNLSNVELTSLIVEPAYEVLGAHKKRSLKGRCLSLIKFVVRKVLPSFCRVYVRRALVGLHTLMSRCKHDISHVESHPLIQVEEVDKQCYFERFNGKVGKVHLHRLMQRPALLVNRHLGGYGLPMEAVGFDFLFFPFFIDPSALCTDTPILMRLHDISFVTSAKHEGKGAKELKAALDGTIAHPNVLFVCNSPYTIQQLENYAPQVKGRTLLVPCQVPRYFTESNTKQALVRHLAAHVSTRHLKKGSIAEVQARLKQLDRYIFVVGGEHARKNYETLLEGWLAYRKSCPQDQIPIVWVGYACNEYTGSFIKDAMPYINSGDIIHLEKVPRQWLNQLFMQATVFVVASHDEGFSMPPVEAQQFGCPVIASDIQVHRWVLGKGARFFDGKKPQQLRNQLIELLSSEAKDMKDNLIALGKKNATRFYKEEVDKQLDTMLEHLMPNTTQNTLAEEVVFS